MTRTMQSLPMTTSLRRWLAAAAIVAFLVGGVPGMALADEPAPPAAAFEPGDISIGEPIALPFTKPKAAAQATAPSTTPQPPLSVLAQPSAKAPAATLSEAGGPAAATGWLGMAVAESQVPGRWAIVDIAADGPAAAAGIRPGDELRSINGAPLTNADEVAQAITAIAAGQPVRLSVARGERVSDVDLVAVPRPPVAAAPQWQASAPPPVVAVPPAPQATTSVLAEPRVVSPAPPAAVATLPIDPPPPAAVPAAPVAPLATPAPVPTAVPARMPAPALAATPEPGSASRGRTALGVRTVPIDPDIQARFRLPAAAGAYVVGVVGDLPASKAGIPPGSVIVRLGDQAVRSPQELTQLVTTGPVDRPIPVEYILPGGAGKRTDVVLQSLERPLEVALVDEGAQPTVVPTLDRGPVPQTARRPVTSDSDSGSGELRREVGRLRGLLEAVERRLDRIGR